MCLVGLAFGASERFPLVIAANRDEFFVRPTAPLDWWEGTLAGRDLQAGGTWLGASKDGRIALVTNVRDQEATPPGRPSRGEIAPHWLTDHPTFDAMEAHILGQGFAGVNVLVFDVFDRARGEHMSNRGVSRTRLPPGIHGLSNASVDTPWPKVLTLKRRLAEALDAPGADELTAKLFEALADDVAAPDEQLPHTGVGLELERGLSSAFIALPQIGYGTRSSTVVVQEGSKLYVTERTYGSKEANATRDRRIIVDPFPA